MTEDSRQLEKLQVLAAMPEWAAIDPASRYRVAAHLELSQAETARVFGVSRQAVRQMADRHGIKFRMASGKALAAQHHGVVQEALSQNMTRAEIVAVTGLSPFTITKHAAGRKILTERQRDIKRLLGEGLTLTETATWLGISPQEVWGNAKKLGIVDYVGKRRKNSLSDYQECSRAGMTRAETAAHLGVRYSAVTNVALRYGLSFRSAR